mgnify:FL=1
MVHCPEIVALRALPNVSTAHSQGCFVATVVPPPSKLALIYQVTVQYNRQLFLVRLQVSATEVLAVCQFENRNLGQDSAKVE